MNPGFFSKLTLSERNYMPRSILKKISLNFYKP